MSQRFSYAFMRKQNWVVCVAEYLALKITYGFCIADGCDQKQNETTEWCDEHWYDKILRKLR